MTATATVHYTDAINALTADATPEFWQDILNAVDADQAQAHADYLKRAENHDDAYYSAPWGSSAARSAAHLNGRHYEHTLVRVNGETVTVNLVDGRYGQVWAITRTDGSIEWTEWVNCSTAATVAKQQKFYATKGYKLVEVETRGRIIKSRWVAGTEILSITEVED